MDGILLEDQSSGEEVLNSLNKTNILVANDSKVKNWLVMTILPTVAEFKNCSRVAYSYQFFLYSIMLLMGLM